MSNMSLTTVLSSIEDRQELYNYIFPTNYVAGVRQIKWEVSLFTTVV